MLPICVTNEAEALLCPIRTVLSKVTGKWQMIILLSLEDGTLRFGQIKRAVGDVTQRVLTENLRSLERDGYITRRVDPGPPIAVFYELTEMGEGLVEKLKLLVFWAGDHYTPVMNARASYEERVGAK